MRDHDLSFSYPSWIQALDCNLKIIKALQALNYRVIMKPHPSFYHLSLSEGEKTYKCDYSLEPFENLIDDAHAIVTCDPHSTTIIECVLKGKPIVAFDYGMFNYPKISQDIDDRIELVKFEYDEKNRLAFDSSQMDKYMQSAQGKRTSRSMHKLFLASESKISLSKHG